MTDYAIQTEDLSKSYGSVDVIRDVSLDVPKAQFSAIVGKSGSGKSTLLGIISGLEKPDAGRVLINGADILRLMTKAWPRRVAVRSASCFKASIWCPRPRPDQPARHSAGG